jgi:hypothetical protein
LGSVYSRKYSFSVNRVFADKGDGRIVELIRQVMAKWRGNISGFCRFGESKSGGDQAKNC